MKLLRLWIVPITLLAGEVAAYAQVAISGNNSKLLLETNEGHFSFLYQSMPLLDNSELTNNEIVIWDNGRQHSLDTAPRFVFKSDRISDVIPSFSWTSPELVVEQSFSLLEPDGLQIRFDITNVSTATRVVGLRYIFDTILGEDSETQFYFSSGDPIRSEITLVPDNSLNSYVISAAQANEPVALQMMLADETVIAPDRVIFANWRRLTRAVWNYRTRSSNDFSIPPFGTPDAAVAYYYDPLPLRARDTRTIIILMGNRTPEGYSAMPPQVEPRDLLASGETPIVELLGGRFTLDELLRFLAAIDLLLEQLLVLEQQSSPDPAEVQDLSRRVQALTDQILSGGNRAQ